MPEFLTGFTCKFGPDRPNIKKEAKVVSHAMGRTYVGYFMQDYPNIRNGEAVDVKWLVPGKEPNYKLETVDQNLFFIEELELWMFYANWPFHIIVED